MKLTYDELVAENKAIRADRDDFAKRFKMSSAYADMMANFAKDYLEGKTVFVGNLPGPCSIDRSPVYLDSGKRVFINSYFGILQTFENLQQAADFYHKLSATRHNFESVRILQEVAQQQRVA